MATEQAAALGKTVHSQIDPSRVKLAEIERNEWVCTAEFGTTLEQVLSPGFWAHKARDLRPYDHIEVRVDDGTWIAQLLVKEAGRNWASVLLLQKFDLDTTDISQTRAAEYKVWWGGPHLKYCVLRISDSARLQEQLTKEAAKAWMENYEKTVAA